MQQDVRVKDFPLFIETLIEQFKSEKFRVGFVKKDGSNRVGKFDLIYRVRWKQTDDTMYRRKGHIFTGMVRVTSLSGLLLKHLRTLQVNKKSYLKNSRS